MQERLEATRTGRVLLTVAFLVLVGSMVVWSMPDSALRTELLPYARPVVGATGTEQAWTVFSPNPRRISLALDATITFDDGTTTTWQVPDSDDPFLAPYRFYRWHKWMEQTRADRNEASLWRPTAEYLVRIHSTPERAVAHVALTRRWTDLPAPGTRGDDAPVWNEYVFYELDVTAGDQ